MLAERCSKFFGAAVRARGDEYATGGMVLRSRVDRVSVRAMVVGTGNYDVKLLRDDRSDTWNIHATCSCPYMEDRGELCKHVWAVLRQAEGRVPEKWGAMPKGVSIHACLPDMDEEEESFDEIGGEEDSINELSRAVERLLKKSQIKRGSDVGAPSKPKKPKVPAWKRMLEETQPNRYGAWNSGVKKREGPIVGGLWYVIDGARSHTNGALVVEVQRGEREEQLTKLPIAAEDIGRITSAEDRAICGMLVGAARPGREFSAYNDHSYRSASEQRAAFWQIDPRLVPVVLPMMEATGRLRWRRDERSAIERARWSPEGAWELAIEVLSESPANSGAEAGGMLRPVVRRAGSGGVSEERVGLDHVLATDGEPGAVMHLGEISPLHVEGGKQRGMLTWARSIMHRPPVRVEREEIAGLLGALEEKRVGLPVAWPEGWGVERVKGVRPRMRLVLNKKRSDGMIASQDKMLAEIVYGYEGAWVQSEAGRYVAVARPDGSSAMVERDSIAEGQGMVRFEELGGKDDGYYGLYVPVKKVAQVAAGLLIEGWEVIGESAAYRKPGEVKIKVSSGIDWFDLEGGVEFGGDGKASATIGAVIAALRKGEKFVSLGDGSMGLLPEEWLAKHGKWLGLGREEDGAVRFGKAQLTLVDALLAELPEATCDKQTAAARAKLRAFEGVTARMEPKGFRGELRPYQRQGLGWLHFLAEFGLGGCLADDMGLGKTVQLLAHMADRRKEGGKANVGPWLVVAPKSLVFNWAREAERFTPGLRIVTQTGPERTTSEKELAKADLVLTTYSTMRLDIELLRKIEFACIVLDEAQGIKNATSQSAKAARLLRGRRRLALTGTPVENRLEDLWSIFEFLNPGMLGTSGAFREALKGGNGTDAADGTDEGKRQGMDILRRALRPFLLRRTKAVVAPELPARSEQTVRCELEGKQKKLYEGLRAHYREQLLGRVEREGMNKSKMHVLEALLRLRQAACHPGLIEVKDSLSRRGEKGGKGELMSAAKGAESAKMETLVEMLEELATEGNKALVFSQFTSLLALVKAELDRKEIGYEELDGSTSAKEREIRVDRFQKVGVKDGGKGVFLISLKAGGVGLNLTAAGYVFLLDPWWNPAVEAQAIDRTHRIGQDKSVMAYRLIATGTVEERILELQERKKELAAAIVSENDGPLSAMTREDLEWLLS